MPSCAQTAAQALVRGVEVLRVVFVVARHVQHRHGPVGKALEPKVFALQCRAALVRADVAREYEHIGVRRGLWHELRVDLEVQVREQLDPHRRAPLL